MSSRSQCRFFQPLRKQRPRPAQALAKRLRAYAAHDRGLGGPETFDADQQKNFAKGRREGRKCRFYSPFELVSGHLLEGRDQQARRPESNGVNRARIFQGS